MADSEFEEPLEVGHDYGGCFGLDPDKGQRMYYNGKHHWTAVYGDKSMSKTSPEQTAKVVEYMKPSAGHSPGNGMLIGGGKK